MRNLKIRIALPVLFTMLGFLAPGWSSGQPLNLDTPEDSPLWWTLTDDLSPSELRSALRTPSAHLERYREAVAKGVAQELSEEQVDALSFYYNRQLTPELTPMWIAFAAFSSAHVEVMGQEHVTEALTAFGFDPAATAVILELGGAQHERSQELALELAEKSQRFVQIQRQAIEARGGDRRAYAAVKRAAERGDLVSLLGSTEVPLATLSELRAAWLRHPIAEVAEQTLPDLRSRLAQEDWERFRSFLLEHVVEGMGSESRDFDYAKGTDK